MAESNPLSVYEVTLRYEDLKLKVHCITKRSLQEELYLAFAVAFESLQTGSSSRNRKRSFFKRSPSHDQGESQLEEGLNAESELSNVVIEVDWTKENSADIVITFRDPKSHNRKWCQRAMAEFGRTQIIKYAKRDLKVLANRILVIINDKKHSSLYQPYQPSRRSTLGTTPISPRNQYVILINTFAKLFVGAYYRNDVKWVTDPIYLSNEDLDRSAETLEFVVIAKTRRNCHLR